MKVHAISINHLDALMLFILLLLAGCATSSAAEPEPGLAALATSPTVVVPPTSVISTNTPVSTSKPPSPPITATPVSRVLKKSTPPITLRSTQTSVPPTATLVPPPTATPAPTPSPQPMPEVSLSLQKIVDKTKRYLLVSQDEQLMYVYEDGLTIRTISVSTGAPAANSFTPAWEGVVGDDWREGTFRNNLRADYVWYLFPGTWGSILIHSVPYIRTDNKKVYDQLDTLGIEPVSNGCVRISPEDAQWLKGWNPVGVPIKITRWSGPIGPPDDSLPQVNVLEPSTTDCKDSLACYGLE